MGSGGFWRGARIVVHIGYKMVVECKTTCAEHTICCPLILQVGRARRSGRGAQEAAHGGGAVGEEGTWGRRPAKVTGAGLEEPARKYMACLRKYLLAYLRLLCVLSDLDTLQVNNMSCCKYWLCAMASWAHSAR